MTYDVWLPKILGLVQQQFGMFKIGLKLFKRFLVDEFTVGVAVGGEGSEANSTNKKKKINQQNYVLFHGSPLIASSHEHSPMNQKLNIKMWV